MARPAFQEDTMSKQKIDVEGILNTLASMRQQIPHLAELKVPADDIPAAAAFVPGDREAMESFELETLADALESFADEVSRSVAAAQEKAMAGALEVYYAAEKLSKEPEHAHLIPHVEAMRAIYRRDFGRDIPERK
ncbi:MAG: hypothetical protein QOE82_2779 [Thermoanaerobaculia bacterium]|jgi:hypothetical protein|nr:hypothetical protein [Thermoanaerobaculia bacterium]